MKRRTNIAILLFTLCISTIASAKRTNYNLDSMVNNFQGLVSYGTPPEDFTSLASAKFKRDAAGISIEESKKMQKTKERFYMMSNFELDQILSSGMVMYNDPVTDYVKNIADILLEDQPSLRDELHFFVTKSSSVNAFTYDNGTIMVNMGLIAQLENESQLAFILAHEIIHYTEKHSIGRHLDRDDLIKGKKDYRGLTFDKRILAYNKNNRKNEEEADTKGFEEIYINSPYALDDLDGVFDVLQYSYLPFDLIQFDLSILEGPYLKMPEDYILEKVNEIGSVIDEDDFEENEEWSSHPSIPKRREYIAELVEENESHGGKEFIQPEELFTQIRTLARFEVIKQDIIYGLYPKAIYNSGVELRNNPDNTFLEKAIAGSLYGLSKYKTARKTSTVVYNYKKVEGESQKLYYLFKRLKKKEMCVTALHYVWQMKQKYPDNEYYEKITDDLFKDLIGKHKVKVKDLSKEPPLTEAEQAIKDSIYEAEFDSLSKYDKIKRKKKEKTKHSDLITYAFVDFFQADSTFEEYYLDMQKEVREDKDYNDDDDDDADDTYSRADADLLADYYRMIKREGLQLGIKKLVIYQPNYSITDSRLSATKKGNRLDYLQTEKKAKEFKEYIHENAELIGLDVEIVESKELDANNEFAFADMMQLRDVMNERLNNSIDLVSFTYDEALEMSEVYGTKYVAVTGVITNRKAKDPGVTTCLTVLGILPGVVYATLPGYETVFYMIVFDIEKGTSEMFFLDFYGTKDRKDLINSKLYYLFYQIQRERELTN